VEQAPPVTALAAGLGGLTKPVARFPAVNSPAIWEEIVPAVVGQELVLLVQVR